MILEDIVEEGKRLWREAQRRGLTLKLIGGLAVYHRCPEARRDGILDRPYPDIDFCGLSSQSKEIQRLFKEMGYRPEERFNALRGRERLLFRDDANHRHLDILLNSFAMCHKLDLRDRLNGDGMTLPVADLALTKLQIVELNAKDVMDIAALFYDHDLGEGDSALDVAYICDLTGKDWGWYKTITRNLAEIPQHWADYGLPREEVIEERMRRLGEEIERHPKTTGWKLRARIGERVRWYELPEEVAR